MRTQCVHSLHVHTITSSGSSQSNVQKPQRFIWVGVVQEDEKAFAGGSRLMNEHQEQTTSEEKKVNGRARLKAIDRAGSLWTEETLCTSVQWTLRANERRQQPSLIDTAVARAETRAFTWPSPSVSVFCSNKERHLANSVWDYRRQNGAGRKFMTKKMDKGTVKGPFYDSVHPLS